jgi:hypothetical protein
MEVRSTARQELRAELRAVATLNVELITALIWQTDPYSYFVQILAIFPLDSLAVFAA